MLEKKKVITKYNDFPYLVYTRVSTDKDEQKDSVPNQVDICRYWLEQNKFEWNEKAILKDDAKTGTLFLNRVAMQLILQKARNREIKMVVFKSIHRLARDLKDSLEIKEVLVGHGVRVVTIEEGFDSLYEGKNDMKFEMHSMFAAQLPKTLSSSISAALAAKVRRGDHIGKIPYGYNRVNQQLVIKDDEAEVIRQIYKWYNVDGFGFKTITNKLNERVKEGTMLLPKNGGAWQLTTIQRIIKNPTFCGTFILNQYATIKVDGRKKQIRNPEEKWFIFEDHHPAIVSKEAWEKANNKPVLNRKTKVSPWNEFRGLLKCGHCGCNMIIMQSWRKKVDGTKTRWRYLKCSKHRRSKQCVNHVPITYEHMREKLIEELLEEGERTKVNLDHHYKKSRDYKIKQIKNKINVANDRKKRLLDLYLDWAIDDKDELEIKRQELDDEIENYNNELFVLNNEVNHDVEINNVINGFKSLKNTKQDLYQVFNTLIDHATVYKDGSMEIQFTFQSEPL